MHSRTYSSNQNNQEKQSIMATILQNLPKECSLTKIEYEGPRIALYSNKPEFLLNNNQVLSNIVNLIKKRIVLRLDESIRKKESEVASIVEKNLSKETGFTDILFDPALGEATVFVRKINEIFSNDEKLTNKLINQTGWKLNFKKTPRSISLLKEINKIACKNSENRTQFYKRIGETIFREKLDPNVEASLISLGGFAEIGRASMILTTNESNILIDCGLNTYTNDPLLMFPRFDSIGIKPSEIDAIVLSHAHFDHTGFVPVLFKYGYDGPVYCTEPTSFLMYLLYREYIKKYKEKALYSEKEIEEVFSHLIYLNYNIVTDLSPDIKITPYNSGHILGSSSFHFHLGNGDHNFVYTGDLKFGKSCYLDNATWNYPRVETLLIEATNGGREDTFPSREEATEKLINKINLVIKDKGTVLIPTQLIGTSQEIIITLDQLIKQKKIGKCKIYVDRLIIDVNSVHESYTEFLNKEVHQNIVSGEYNPFRSKNLNIINIMEEKKDLDPGVMLLPSSMLQCLHSIDYLKKVIHNPNNMIIFICNQMNGTVGKSVIDKQKEISLNNIKYNIECKIETIYSFNSHSDFNQLNAYISRLKPKLRRILINHGERYKVQNFASYSSKVHNIPTQYQLNQEATKIL
ncbi:MAG: beta-CASP ribonuclease aCPSF1 [Nitrosopumilus sp.]|nr:beta-CASP ribonuclease aCPSF1 [Nitrosopumilus sp.]